MIEQVLREDSENNYSNEAALTASRPLEGSNVNSSAILLAGEGTVVEGLAVKAIWKPLVGSNLQALRSALVMKSEH